MFRSVSRFVLSDSGASQLTASHEVASSFQIDDFLGSLADDF